MTREDRGIILRFLVRERPNIKAVEFEGNSEIENDKLQEAIEVRPDDDMSSLEARVLEVEHRLLPRAVRALVEGRIVVDGRHVTITEGDDG